MKYLIKSQVPGSAAIIIDVVHTNVQDAYDRANEHKRSAESGAIIHVAMVSDSTFERLSPRRFLDGVKPVEELPTMSAGTINALATLLDNASPKEIWALRQHCKDKSEDFAVKGTRRVIWKAQYRALVSLCKCWHITGDFKP